jgi:hypothetical protein
LVAEPGDTLIAILDQVEKRERIRHGNQDNASALR